MTTWTRAAITAHATALAATQLHGQGDCGCAQCRHIRQQRNAIVAATQLPTRRRPRKPVTAWAGHRPRVDLDLGHAHQWGYRKAA